MGKIVKTSFGAVDGQVLEKLQERVFQVRQLKKLKAGDPIFFRRICQVIWSDGSESHSNPIYSHWTFVSMCEEYVTISGDPDQL